MTRSSAWRSSSSCWPRAGRRVVRAGGWRRAGDDGGEQFGVRRGVDDPGPLHVRRRRSLPLSWSGVPDDAAAVALVVDDPDAPIGTFAQLGAWTSRRRRRRPRRTRCPTAASRRRRRPATRRTRAVPPMRTHRYRFTVVALDAETASPRGFLDEALAAVDDHAIATGVLTAPTRATDPDQQGSAATTARARLSDSAGACVPRPGARRRRWRRPPAQHAHHQARGVQAGHEGVLQSLCELWLARGDCGRGTHGVLGLLENAGRVPGTRRRRRGRRRSMLREHRPDDRDAERAPSSRVASSRRDRLPHEPAAGPAGSTRWRARW